MIRHDTENNVIRCIEAKGTMRTLAIEVAALCTSIYSHLDEEGAELFKEYIEDLGEKHQLINPSMLERTLIDDVVN